MHAEKLKAKYREIINGCKTSEMKISTWVVHVKTQQFQY